MREVYLLQFGFKVSKAIKNLQFFHGVYWSAVLRELLRKQIPAEYGSKDFLDKMGIYPIPVLNGLTELQTDAYLYYNLILPIEFKQLLLNCMEYLLKNKYREFNFPVYSSIKPGENISFAQLRCLLSGESDPAKWKPLDMSYIHCEQDSLKNHSELTVVFHTPLRLHRSGKSDDRQWADTRYWDTGFFLSKLNESLFAGIPMADIASVQTVDRGLLWIDAYDGYAPLGGLCGAIRLRLPDGDAIRRMLVQGQYCGLGKNRSLGFGFYHLGESELNPLFQCPQQAETLLAKAADISLLSRVLDELDADSAGPDGLCAGDLKQNRGEYLHSASINLAKGSYLPGEVKRISISDDNGKQREINIRNIMERHMLRALQSILYDATDKQFDICAYAFRKGKGYLDAVRATQKGLKKGFKTGVAADIEACFDSIPPAALALLMWGLLGCDPIRPVINKVISLREMGLEQGNPLSPLLANIYLMPLDREFRRTGYHYVRYADDFVVLDKLNQDSDKLMQTVEDVLSTLKLRLHPDKTEVLSPESEFTFLGCRISNSGYVCIADLDNKTQTSVSEVTEKSDEPEAVLPDLIKGIPVYVTFKDTSVRCTERELIIESGEDTKHISWKMVNRIVIIGKPRISAYAIYRALTLQKPVVFLSIGGKHIGAFYPKLTTESPKSLFNDSVSCYEEFELDFIRKTAIAKLNNQSMLLKARQIDVGCLEELIKKCQISSEVDTLRGYEGAGAAYYWKQYAELINSFNFQQRKYHPSPDPVNALLSLGYSIMYNRMAEGLIAAGLSPWDGVYHKNQGKHYALASDMMEPFRFLIDRIVLALINTSQITEDDFRLIESPKGNYCRLEGDGFAKYINRYEYTMHDHISALDDFSGSWAELLDYYCRKLINCLRIGIPFEPYLHKK